MTTTSHMPALIHATQAGGMPLVVDAPAWLAPQAAGAASPAGPAVLAGVLPLAGRPGALLCLVPPGVTVLLNGAPAPRAIVLKERDELTLRRAGVVVRYHVTVRHAAAVQPAPAGRHCALCSDPVEAGAPAYTCVCGTLLHAATNECAHTTPDCPRCLRPIHLKAESGFTYWPEELA